MQPRFWEEEGFYVGKPPQVSPSNLNIMENRIMDAKEVCVLTHISLYVVYIAVTRIFNQFYVAFVFLLLSTVSYLFTSLLNLNICELQSTDNNSLASRVSFQLYYDFY